jgi:hypothetical protein
MIAIKTLRNRKPFFGYNRKPKIKYMSGDRYQDQLHCTKGGHGHIRDTEITLEKIFENQAYLAHNHWIGVFRITYVVDWEELGVRAGDFDQFVVDTAAGKDTVVEKIQRAVLDELEYHNIDPNLNMVDLKIQTIGTRTGTLRVDTTNQIR